MKLDGKLCYDDLLIYADDTHIVTQRVRNMMENLCVLYCSEENPNNGLQIDMAN